MADTSELEVDDVIDNRYKLVRQLGEGTYAVVWLVWDKRFNRYSVLKMLKSKIKGALVRRRVIAEARIMASLWTGGHPHRDRIAEVRDVSDESAELIYIVLEVVDGGDLQRKLYFEKPSVHAALSMFLLILHGVQVAHERTLDGEPAPVIHRDLKPGNVLLTKRGLPKVTDFGIANAAHSMTEEGVAVVPFGTTVGKREGTLGFAPPEQTNDASSVDVRSDLYSLGVILAVLIADFDPGEQGQRLLYQQKTQREHLADVADDIRTVIVTACAADPDHRYQDILEFIAATEELIAAHPDTGEPAWTPREGRARPAAVPTPKTPAPAATPDAPPVSTAVPVASEPEDRGPLWTEVGADDVQESEAAAEVVAPPSDPFDEPEPAPRKWQKGWIVGVVAVIAIVGIGAVMLWPGADPVNAETPVDAPAEPVPAVTPKPVEAKAETPTAPIEPVVEPKVEPKPEAKTETKVEVRPRVAVKPKVEPVKPKVEPPKAEDPRPEPVTATKVAITKSVATAKVGETITAEATVVLPEGETITSTTLRWRGEGGAWQSKTITVAGGKASGTIAVNATMGTRVEYYIDVRAASAPGKANKSTVVTTTIVP